MDKKNYELSLSKRISLFFKVMSKDKIQFKRNFLKYHLLRRKYTISRSSEFFGKNKFEPAPLLGRKILDIGCGLNGISDELAFRGADILAIDNNLEILTTAKNNALHNGSPVDYQNLSLHDISEEKKYDMVLLLDFVNQKNIKSTFKKVNDVLKDDGLLIISGSNKSLKSFIRNIFVPKFFLKMLHLNIRSKDLIKLKTVKHKLEKYGFNILGTQGVDFSFISGKWHKTKSTRVRYIMYASKTIPEHLTDKKN